MKLELKIKQINNNKTKYKTSYIFWSARNPNCLNNLNNLIVFLKNNVKSIIHKF